MLSCIKHKLKSKQGFILAEQLISIIFIGLLCVAVTAGLGAAMSAFANITKKTESQALLNRAVQEVSDEFAFSLNPASPSYVSGTLNASVTLINQTKEGSRGIALSGLGIESGETAKGTETVLLVPEAGGFVPAIKENYSYDAKTNTWTFTIEIMQDGDTNSIATTTMTVARVGQ